MYISEKCAVSQTKQRWYGSLRGPRVTTGSQVRGGVGPHRVPCLPGPVAGTPCGTPRQVAGLLMTGYNPRIIDGRCQNYPPEKKHIILLRSVGYELSAANSWKQGAMVMGDVSC